MGETTSCYNLGTLYCHGKDIERDFTKAVELFKMAYKRG